MIIGARICFFLGKGRSQGNRNVQISFSAPERATFYNLPLRDRVTKKKTAHSSGVTRAETPIASGQKRERHI